MRTYRGVMMATVELVIHIEAADGEAVWWAESPEVPGFSAAAPTLAELRERATAALTELQGAPVRLTERLVGGEETGDVRVAKTELLVG
jgi:predicted RNase H-like HicB family nuclease